MNVILAVGAASMLIPGVWAFVAPGGFAESVAQFDPYNQHYLRDVGAFQIGLGVAACVALRWRDGVVVALTGLLVADGAHAVSHLIDWGDGGRSLDAPALLVLTVLALIALVVRNSALRRVSAENVGDKIP